MKSKYRWREKLKNEKQKYGWREKLERWKANIIERKVIKIKSKLNWEKI